MPTNLLGEKGIAVDAGLHSVLESVSNAYNPRILLPGIGLHAVTVASWVIL